SVPVGLSRPFIAVAELTDGSTLDVTNDPAISWTSDNTTIATVSTGLASHNGIARGVAVGTATITASGSANGMSFSASGELNVSDVTVTRLQVTPASDGTPVGLSKPFKAIAVLSDRTTIDVTDDPTVSWASDDITIATVISGQPATPGSQVNGIATGVTKGITFIKATGMAGGKTFSGKGRLTVKGATATALEVSPASVETPVGLARIFTATVVMSDGTRQDVTNDPATSWTSDNLSIATVTSHIIGNGNGLAHAIGVGSSHIQATTVVGGVTLTSNQAVLTVTNKVPVALVVTPLNVTAPMGVAHNFVATAVYSDGTRIPVTDDPAISWTSSDASIATVTSSLASGNGVTVGASMGDATITASANVAGKDFAGHATLHVTAATPTSLVITPDPGTAPIGMTQEFKAEATFTDGTTLDVTNDPDLSWTLADGAVATITTSQETGNGIATGAAEGVTTVTATLSRADVSPVSDDATLNVTPARIASLVVTPATTSVTAETTQQYTATATLTDGSSVDATASSYLSWSTADTAIATVGTSGETGGLVSALVVGTTTVTVTADAAATSTGSAITASAEVVVACNPVTTICVYEHEGRMFTVPPTVKAVQAAGATTLTAHSGAFGRLDYGRFTDSETHQRNNPAVMDADRLGVSPSDVPAALAIIREGETTDEFQADLSAYCNSLNVVYWRGRANWKVPYYNDVEPYLDAMREEKFIPFVGEWDGVYNSETEHTIPSVTTSVAFSNMTVDPEPSRLCDGHSDDLCMGVGGTSDGVVSHLYLNTWYSKWFGSKYVEDRNSAWMVMCFSEAM
ncbi:TPA: Ig-like domain-containing protein, partial [Aeromonas dhakensis]|nr:Ig-like domain-containing protein [Aeromonas dhakensis]